MHAGQWEVTEAPCIQRSWQSCSAQDPLPPPPTSHEVCRIQTRESIPQSTAQLKSGTWSKSNYSISLSLRPFSFWSARRCESECALGARLMPRGESRAGRSSDAGPVLITSLWAGGAEARIGPSTTLSPAATRKCPPAGQVATERFASWRQHSRIRNWTRRDSSHGAVRNAWWSDHVWFSPPARGGKSFQR